MSYCVQLAKTKVQTLNQELASTREATTSEDKSTAGDKHETGRAMMHLEQEKLHRQLAEAETIVAELERIDPVGKASSIQLGTLAVTDRASFFIASGLGKIQFEGKDYFVISAQAPIAKEMLGRKLGERFSVNGTEYVITSVE